MKAMRWLAMMGVTLALAGVAQAQVGGNLVQYPPVDVRFDITTAPDGKPVVTPGHIDLVTGDYYRLTLSSDGQGKDTRGEPLARRVELNEFLANIHLRILTISGIEVHLQGMSFRAIELDEKGAASFTFTPIRPGEYQVYVGPNPFGLGRPAGEQGVQTDPKVAFATISVK